MKKNITLILLGAISMQLILPTVLTFADDKDKVETKQFIEIKEQNSKISREIINIPDVNLKSGIAKKLGKDAKSDITKLELEGITSLEINDDINNLEGIQYCINLKNLSLGKNYGKSSLKDISRLSRLTRLNSLSLKGSNISDISPLSGLFNLYYLSMPWNNISDITPLEMLTNLTTINLDFNQINDLNPLKGLNKLEKLYMQNNKIYDLSPLKYSYIRSANFINQSIELSEIITSTSEVTINNIVKNNDGNIIPPLISSDYDYSNGKITFKNISATGQRSYNFNKQVVFLGKYTNPFSGSVTQNIVKKNDFIVNKAFDSSLYYARSILSEEGQKAWDIALDTLLKYDNSDGRYPIKDGNRVVTINYKDLGISIDKNQAQYIQKYLVRQEPRMFHLKDWGATVKTDKDGLVESQTFYIGNGMSEGNTYQETLLKIEPVVKNLLSYIKNDMTVYQKIQAIQKAFESSITYSHDGSPSDIRGVFLNKKAICGGYSKGFEYLLLRLGIENIWVEGQAGGYHAWNHVKVEDKWYLMDTTWGGQNWYLRGEVENHKANSTYHVMPTLEKEGIPYVWGKYPGVWINTPNTIAVTLGSEFNPLRYVQNVGDIYSSDLNGNISILQNNVNTKIPGNYEVIYQIKNRDGNIAKSKLAVKVINGEEILAKNMNQIFGNMSYKPVSLYLNGDEIQYDDGIFKAESGEIEYNITGENLKYFSATVGINKNVRDNTNYGHYGKVQFEVYADDKLIYTSSVLGWKDNCENIFIEIPKKTKTIRLVNIPKGVGNNHGAWGNPTFFKENTNT